MSDRMRDLVGGVLFLLLAAYVGWNAYGFGFWDYGEPGAGLMPGLVAVLMAAFALLEIGRVALGAASPPPIADDAPPVERFEAKRLIGYIVALAGFVALMDSLGTIATVAVVFLFILVVVERFAIKTSLAVSLGGAAGTWLLFERLLEVPLPHGVLW